MSCADLFMKYGLPSTEANFTKYFYYQRADKLMDRKHITEADKRAERDIKELLQLVSDLREYRQALAARYASLETMSYQLKLELERRSNYNGKKFYDVRITRTYEDGSMVKEFEESYPGTERHKALARYEELKKQRPGIDCTKDIAKKSWEK